MMFLTKIKAKLAVAGAAILAVLGFFLRLQYLKNKNERLTRKAETLEARVVQEKNIKREEKKVKEEYRDREVALVKELEKIDEEDSEGLDNFTNSNDW